jgi:hypothetical protein
MRYRFSIAAVLLSTIICGIQPASAHHSFAMFDRSKEVTLVGTVKEFQWTNPHCWLQLVVVSDGQTKEWSFEGGSPGILSRHGWKHTSLKEGDKVTVTFYPLLSGEAGGSFIQVVTPTGSTLYYHG